jgi:hypothetical protein
MKSQRFMLSAVLALSTAAFAQRILDVTPFSSVPFLGEDPMPASAFAGAVLVANASPSSASEPTVAQSDTHKMDAPKTAAPKSEAQLAFDKMKTLEGSWEGHMNTPTVPQVDGMVSKVTFRVVSRGHTLMHDMKSDRIPDEPITMFVVDNDRLLLTHYCDGDNRPRMTGKTSADGKTVEFDFIDISGKLNVGHMHHAVFTFIDDNHHTEDWTYMMPGDRPMHARINLERTQNASGAPSK